MVIYRNRKCVDEEEYTSVPCAESCRMVQGSQGKLWNCPPSGCLKSSESRRRRSPTVSRERI